MLLSRPPKAAAGFSTTHLYLIQAPCLFQTPRAAARPVQILCQLAAQAAAVLPNFQICPVAQPEVQAVQAAQPVNFLL